jgi:hypothetical protein
MRPTCVDTGGLFWKNKNKKECFSLRHHPPASLLHDRSLARSMGVKMKLRPASKKSKGHQRPTRTIVLLGKASIGIPPPLSLGGGSCWWQVLRWRQHRSRAWCCRSPSSDSSVAMVLPSSVSSLSESFPLRSLHVLPPCTPLVCWNGQTRCTVSILVVCYALRLISILMFVDRIDPEICSFKIIFCNAMGIGCRRPKSASLWDLMSGLRTQTRPG